MISGWKILTIQHATTGFYGTGLFIFAPVFAGFIAGSISNWNEVRPRATLWLSALLQCVFITIALMAFAIEGMVCVVMALPLIYPILAAGFTLGKVAMNSWRGNRRIFVSALPVIVGMGVASNALDPNMVTKLESTTFIINAPPEKIWPYLFELKGLPEPDQLIFKTGIAYTYGTRAGGQTVGSSRQCLLTTGVMNETISAVTKDRYLRFNVLNTPPSIKEHNPFYDIHPRHESGCFRVHWGEFRLEPLPGGRTRFTGTSSYSYNIYPAWYWGLLTDTVAEQIHVRMMGEIKRRVER